MVKGLFFGSCGEGVHKFQPRYSRVAPEYLSQYEKMNFTGINLSDFYEKHYECDVCVRCGVVVQKDKQK